MADLPPWSRMRSSSPAVSARGCCRRPAHVRRKGSLSSTSLRYVISCSRRSRLDVTDSISSSHRTSSNWVSASGADRATTAHLLEKRPDIHPSLIGPLPAEVSLEIHVQPIANGLGGAIAVALPMIDGPFLVLLGDNLLLDRHVPPDHQWVASSASMHLVEAHHRTGRPVAGIHEVPGSEVSQYGVVALEGEMIRDLVEKPLREEAPSNSVLCGRYLWTKDTAGLLDRFDVRSHGEMQTIEIQRHWMAAEGGMWPSHWMNSNGTTVVPPYLG